MSRTGNALDEVGRVAELPSDAILTRQEVATWLRLRPRQVERLGVPVLDMGLKTKRYLKRDVQAWLEAQRRPARAGSLRRAS